VRAAIQWGLPPADKQVPPTSVPLRPSLRESHVAATNWAQYGPSGSAVDTSMTLLSHIEILPSALASYPTGPSAGQSQPMAPALVLTVRPYVAQDGSPYHQETQSVIDRWEILIDQPQSLHPAFAQLGSKNGAPSAPPVCIPQMVVECAG
jgi:mediator of RNA polymerase II transcription subunit 16